MSASKVGGVEAYLVWARVAVGALLALLALSLIVSPPVGGVPIPEIVAPAIGIAGALTIVGRRYDIAVRILWAITGATFALTLVHYNVACTVLYSGENLAIPPDDVWLACATAWPLFSAPALSGALVVLLLAVRTGFAQGSSALADVLASPELATIPATSAGPPPETPPRVKRTRRPPKD